MQQLSTWHDKLSSPRHGEAEVDVRPRSDSWHLLPFESLVSDPLGYGLLMSMARCFIAREQAVVICTILFFLHLHPGIRPERHRFIKRLSLRSPTLQVQPADIHALLCIFAIQLRISPICIFVFRTCFSLHRKGHIVLWTRQFRI